MEKAVFSTGEIGRILGKGKKNKKKIEQHLNVTFNISKINDLNSISIESKKEPFNEYTARTVLEALAFGFDLDTALQLRDTDFLFRRIDIKAYVKGSRVSVVKGRIIGMGGKTKRILEKISDCDIVVRENSVGIIGNNENVDAAGQAILALIRGAPASAVYARLEMSMAKVMELKEEDVEKLIEKKKK